MEHIITKDNFKTEVLDAKETVLIDFWAPWCPPCRMLSPVISEIANERKDIKVCKVNTDEEEELSSLFKVTNIPLVVVMKEGTILKTSVGYKDKDEILKML